MEAHVFALRGRGEIHITPNAEPLTPGRDQHGWNVTALCGDAFRADTLLSLPRPKDAPCLRVCECCVESANANGLEWRTQ
jgi:hypothetical protein